MRSEEFMNAEDVARYLHLGKNTVYQLAKSGKIASYHVGRKLKFTLEDVEAYVASTHHAPRMVAAAAAPVHPEPMPTGVTDEGAADIVDAASFGKPQITPLVIAGGDASADLMASALNASGTPVTRLVRGSYTSLVNLYAGEADAAVVHLYDQLSNSCNVPYVRNLAPGLSVVVFRLCTRNQGFIVQKGNPKNITSWGGLLREGVRLANRAKGTGARILLDEKLRAMEARCEVIEGYDASAPVGDAAVRRVASGIADVTVGTEREALRVAGVQFVPLQSESVDLVVRKAPETRPFIRRIGNLLEDEAFKRSFEALGPCTTSNMGSIVYES